MIYKRFMIFSHAEYYPAGGLNDVRGHFDTLDECTKAIENDTVQVSGDGWYIFDRIEGIIVKESN